MDDTDIERTKAGNVVLGNCSDVAGCGGVVHSKAWDWPRRVELRADQDNNMELVVLTASGEERIGSLGHNEFWTPMQGLDGGMPCNLPRKTDPDPGVKGEYLRRLTLLREAEDARRERLLATKAGCNGPLPGWIPAEIASAEVASAALSAAERALLLQPLLREALSRAAAVSDYLPCDVYEAVQGALLALEGA